MGASDGDAKHIYSNHLLCDKQTCRETRADLSITRAALTAARAQLKAHEECHERLTESEKRTDAWSLALQSLTPGGSEYVDDPAACVAYVRQRRETEHAAILKLTTQLQEARDRAQSAESVSAWMHNDAEISSSNNGKLVSELAEAKVEIERLKTCEHCGRAIGDGQAIYINGGRYKHVVCTVADQRL